MSYETVAWTATPSSAMHKSHMQITHDVTAGSWQRDNDLPMTESNKAHVNRHVGEGRVSTPIMVLCSDASMNASKLAMHSQSNEIVNESEWQFASKQNNQMGSF